MLIDVHGMMRMIQENHSNEVILANKEDVLDMLYIQYANQKMEGWSLKVFEKVFEESPVCFVPGTNPSSVSITDTVDFISSISAAILQASETIIAEQGPLLNDLLLEKMALEQLGTEEYQLGLMTKRIDNITAMIEKSTMLLNLANEEVEKAEQSEKGE